MSSFTLTVIALDRCLLILKPNKEVSSCCHMYERQSYSCRRPTVFGVENLLLATL